MLAVRDPILNSVRAHWERLRGGRMVPYRAEIEPEAFEAALGNMFILERISAGDVRIRIAGIKLCEFMGMEVRGLPLTSFMQDRHRRRLDQIIGIVLEHPATAELHFAAIDSEGERHDAKMLLLPLRSNFGDISRIIGCLSLPQTDLPQPIRLTVTAQHISPLELPAYRPMDGPLPGFFEDAPAYVADARPMLRKIIDNGPAAPRRTREKSARLQLVHDGGPQGE